MPVQSNDVQHFLTSFALPVQSSWLVFQLSLAWATWLHKGESQVFSAFAAKATEYHQQNLKMMHVWQRALGLFEA